MEDGYRARRPVSFKIAETIRRFFKLDLGLMEFLFKGIRILSAVPRTIKIVARAISGNQKACSRGPWRQRTEPQVPPQVRL